MTREINQSGIPIQPFYDRIEGAPHDLGTPGEFPYGRGIRKDMYRGRLWTMRQYAGFGTAAESNARYRYLLERGQTGLSVAFDRVFFGEPRSKINAPFLEFIGVGFAPGLRERARAIRVALLALYLLACCVFVGYVLMR